MWTSEAAACCCHQCFQSHGCRQKAHYLGTYLSRASSLFGDYGVVLRARSSHKKATSGGERITFNSRERGKTTAKNKVKKNCRREVASPSYKHTESYKAPHSSEKLGIHGVTRALLLKTSPMTRVTSDAPTYLFLPRKYGKLAQCPRSKLLTSFHALPTFFRRLPHLFIAG